MQFFESASSIGMDLRSEADISWTLLAGAGSGAALTAPSSYANVAWWSSSQPGPRLAVVHDSSGCTSLQNSSLHVDELRRFTTGGVRSLSLGFVQRCTDHPPMTGTVRFRAGDQTAPAPWMIEGTVTPVPTPTSTPVPEPTPTPTVPEPTPTVTAGETPAPSPPATTAPGPGSTPVPTPTSASGPTGPCSKKEGRERLRCQLARKRKAALKRCDRLAGRKHTRCVRRAKKIGRFS